MTSTLGQRLVWRDGDVRVSQCGVCRHKHPGGPTCDAFPDAIPIVFLRNERSHAVPVDGDHGIGLEPIEIAADMFQHITGLVWPPDAVDYATLEALIDRARAGGALDGELAS